MLCDTTDGDTNRLIVCHCIYLHSHPVAPYNAMISNVTMNIVVTYTRCIKNSNLRKEVGIAIKGKETSSQFESVRNSYVAIMHQPVTICSTM